MNASGFLRHRREHDPGTPPTGHLLRHAFPTRRFRIDSLPEAQRYADTPREHREVPRRRNALITRLIGDGGHVVLLRSGHFSDPTSCSPEGVTRPASHPGRYMLTVTLDDPMSMPYAHICMGSHGWRPGRWNDLLRLVVRRRVTGVPMVGIDRPCVIAPYDGGVDVRLASEEERDRERCAHIHRLSPHPTGLRSRVCS